MVRMLAALGVLLVAIGPAQAADQWKRGETRHFVVYSTMKERDLHDQLEWLERVDGAIRLVRGQSDPDVGDGNRVTIFMVEKQEDLRHLSGRPDDTWLGGFYTFREEGPIAITLEIEGSDVDQRRATFIHEYAHHLLLAGLRHPTPKWLIEGWAEYFSTADVSDDGSVVIGKPMANLAYSLQQYGMVPMEQLFDQRYEYKEDDARSAFYATSWLLTHYLSFEMERRPAFENYLRLMSEGVPSREAGPRSFGPLANLEKELEEYRDGRISYLKIDADRLPVPHVSIERLDEGSAQAVEHYAAIWLDRGDADAAAAMREITARYPEAPLAWTTLAMAETTAERWEAAEAAAREAVRLRPAKVEPKALLARVLLRRSEELADAEAQEALIDEAIDLSRAASAIDPEDPEPLVLFYRAKLARKGRGDEESINALYDAALIAPQDLGTRLNAATALLNVGLVAEARDLLDPISFDPHNREAAATARQLIDMSENRSAGGRVVIEMAPASD